MNSFYFVFKQYYFYTISQSCICCGSYCWPFSVTFCQQISWVSTFMHRARDKYRSKFWSVVSFFIPFVCTPFHQLLCPYVPTRNPGYLN